MDRDAVLTRVGGDVVLMREIVALFLEDCPRALGEIRSAIRQQDAARLKLTAHAFKGAVGNFAAAAAVASALRLEKMGRAGDLTGAGEAFAELEAEVQQLLPGLALLAQPE